MLLKFEKVVPTSQQISDLYLLLKKRKNFISHNFFPNPNDHKKFVQEHPYLAWYLIYQNDELIGTVYIQSDNSVGLNITHSIEEIVSEIINFIKKNHNPLPPIKSVRRKEFFFIISPNNKKLITILNQLGKCEIQRSFAL